MAAILRLAGGFDRSHTQQVQAVIVCRDADGLEMRVVSPELPEVDIWGARRRAEFFERVFKTQLTITWQQSTRPGIMPEPEHPDDEMPAEVSESVADEEAVAKPDTNGAAKHEEARSQRRRKGHRAGQGQS
jgi:hypothetical protein